MIRRGFGSAAAVCRPLSGGTSGSWSPWITSVGMVSRPSAAVRSGAVTIAASWRMAPSGRIGAIDRALGLPPGDLGVERHAGAEDEPPVAERLLDPLVTCFPRRRDEHRADSRLCLDDVRTAHGRHDRGEAQHAFGMVDRDELGDHASHRRTHDMGGVDAYRVEDADGVALPCRRVSRAEGRCA